LATCSTQQPINERNKIRKIYQRTNTAKNKKKLTEHREKINRSLIQHKNKAWKAKLRQVNPKDNTLWQVDKTLKKNRAEIPPLQTQDGSEAATEKEKAEALADYFQSVHLPKTPSTQEQEVKSLLEKITTQSEK
jgi:hypothetical protein